MYTCIIYFNLHSHHTVNDHHRIITKIGVVDPHEVAVVVPPNRSITFAVVTVNVPPCETMPSTVHPLAEEEQEESHRVAVNHVPGTAVKAVPGEIVTFPRPEAKVVAVPACKALTLLNGWIAFVMDNSIPVIHSRKLRVVIPTPFSPAAP